MTHHVQCHLPTKCNCDSIKRFPGDSFSQIRDSIVCVETRYAATRADFEFRHVSVVTTEMTATQQGRGIHRTL